MAAVRHLGFVEGSRGSTHKGLFVVAVIEFQICICVPIEIG